MKIFSLVFLAGIAAFIILRGLYGAALTPLLSADCEAD